MRRKLVVGNWKMHGSQAINLSLLQAVRAGAGQGAELAVCVPFPYLQQAQSVLEGSAVAWGAQDVSAHIQGAYTGEVSVNMLKDFACRYAIVGHSERRCLHAECDAEVVAKANATLQAGLCPIICVGETLAERDAGETATVVLRQLDAVIAGCGIAALAKSVLAYEPVWAIGTGRTATPEQAQEVHALLRKRVAAEDAAVASDLTILYGGSVKAANAKELFAQPDIDGGLVGGASLVAEEFLAIGAAV
ncbi:MAG TPA: triose-phosphate isomerase [Rhodocyclaceae bacterium]|jgi:triosephosphate isomerase|nr:triose-phosphate isomerase [Rhodocyclaceae bacterium]